jgi:hypothetical protein
MERADYKDTAIDELKNGVLTKINKIIGDFNKIYSEPYDYSVYFLDNTTNIKHRRNILHIQSDYYYLLDYCEKILNIVIYINPGKNTIFADLILSLVCQTVYTFIRVIINPDSSHTRNSNIKKSLVSIYKNIETLYNFLIRDESNDAGTKLNIDPLGLVLLVEKFHTDSNKIDTCKPIVIALNIISNLYRIFIITSTNDTSINRIDPEKCPEIKVICRALWFYIKYYTKSKDNHYKTNRAHVEIMERLIKYTYNGIITIFYEALIGGVINNSLLSREKTDKHFDEKVRVYRTINGTRMVTFIINGADTLILTSISDILKSEDETEDDIKFWKYQKIEYIKYNGNIVSWDMEKKYSKNGELSDVSIDRYAINVIFNKGKSKDAEHELLICLSDDYNLFISHTDPEYYTDRIKDFNGESEEKDSISYKKELDDKISKTIKEDTNEYIGVGNRIINVSYNDSPLIDIIGNVSSIKYISNKIIFIDRYRSAADETTAKYRYDLVYYNDKMLCFLVETKSGKTRDEGKTREEIEAIINGGNIRFSVVVGPRGFVAAPES